jgi:hypothetical protein
MKKETAIYPSHRKLLGTTLAAAIMTTLSCLLVIVQPHGKVGGSIPLWGTKHREGDSLRRVSLFAFGAQKIPGLEESRPWM